MRQDHYHTGPEAITYANPVKHPLVYRGRNFARDIYHSHDNGREPHTHAPCDNFPMDYISTVVDE